jgi:hypothetical protein
LGTRPTNIFLAHAVFKSGGVELYGNAHASLYRVFHVIKTGLAHFPFLVYNVFC